MVFVYHDNITIYEIYDHNLRNFHFVISTLYIFRLQVRRKCSNWYHKKIQNIELKFYNDLCQVIGGRLTLIESKLSTKNYQNMGLKELLVKFCVRKDWRKLLNYNLVNYIGQFRKKIQRCLKTTYT